MSSLSFTGWVTLLSITTISVSTLLNGNCAIAQISSDGTLPTNIKKEGNTFSITGGTQAGSNLFHSFGEFSVPTNNIAYFKNTANIQNIFSRVTGKSISNIDGLIKANGTANLFLINPNGIIFSQNAQSNIGGSFLASTASAIKFADNLEFSTTNPKSAQLLSINVPLGLQFGTNPGSIINQSQAIDSQGEFVGFQVKPEKTLALVGGDVAIVGGVLTAPSGRIELGSVGANSFVSLKTSDTNLTFSYEGVENLKNIYLAQRAYVTTNGDSGGGIQVRSANLVLIDDSQISANTLGDGTGTGLTINTDELLIQDGAQVGTRTFGSAKGGDLNVTAKKVQVIGFSRYSNLPSFLASQANPGATGDTGNLTINTGELLIQDGAQVGTRTVGSGKAENLNVTANKVQVIGSSRDGQFLSSLGSIQGQVTATGGAGNLTINTGELLIQDGGEVGSRTLGNGKAGNLNLTANKVQVIGRSRDGQYPSFLASLNSSGITGDAGNLTINTGELLIKDGGQVGTVTYGSGKAGNLDVTANKVQVIGRSSNGQFSSFLASQTNPGATGDAGNLTINTGELLIEDGGQISSGTSGSGKGGNLTINTGELLIKDGGQISSSTSGSGKGGNLDVTANKVQVISRSSDDLYPSLLASQVNLGATGDAGNLTINTGELLIENGGQVSGGTDGNGKGGNLNVTADKVQVIGRSSNGQFSSYLASQSDLGATGNAGNLTINTGELLIKDGGQVGSGTFGSGKGGNLNITADKVQVIGRSGNGQFSSFLASQTNPGTTGDAGNLTIRAGELLIQDGGQVSSSTYGSGKGGNLNVTANKVEVIGTSSNDYATGLYAVTVGTGKAGNLSIATQQLLLSDRGLATVESRGKGVAGDLGITANLVRLDNSQITAQTLSGNGGNLNLNISDFLLMRNGSQISTNAGTAQQGGDGGSITINTPNGFIIAVPRENSDITANAFTGKGGRVDINAFGIYGIQKSQKPTPLSDITASSEFGVNGTVKLNTPDINPNSDLVELPTITADTQVVQICDTPGYAQSSFVITGSGGLPPNPTQDIRTADSVEVDWVSLKPSTSERKNSSVTTKSTVTPERIVEASGWVLNEKGEVVLIANVPTDNPRSVWHNPITCRVSHSQE